MLVLLTGDDVRDAHARADAIQERKERAGIPSNVFHGDTCEVRRAAFRAEAAFHRAFPQATPSADPVRGDGRPDPGGNDGGYDFLFRSSGVTVDVKSTARPARRLLVMERHWPPKADIYVLGEVRAEREVMLVGWAWAEDLMDAPVYRGNAGPYRCIPSRGLRTMSTLLAEVR